MSLLVQKSNFHPNLVHIFNWISGKIKCANIIQQRVAVLV